MNILNKLFFLFFIPITIMSQTQGEVLKYMDSITLIHNSFMKSHTSFLMKNDLNDVNKLALISNLVDDHKLTLINLEKIEKVNWDKDLLSDLISAHKIMHQNLITSREEYESVLNLNEKFSNYEDIYNQIRITVKLNEYVANLSTKFKAKQIELYTQHNIPYKASENAELARNYNERASYINGLQLIKLPVNIAIEKLFSSCESEDLEGLKRNINNLTELIYKSEEKLNEINIIRSGKNLFNTMNYFLKDWDKFNEDNKNTFIEKISLSETKVPNEPKAPDQSLAQKNKEKYDKDFDEYEKDYYKYQKYYDNYNIVVDNFNKLIEDYNTLNEKYISQFKDAKSSFMQF